MIELFRMGVQASDNISEAFTLGKLTEAHTRKLVPAGKASYSIVTAIFVYDSREALLMDQLHQLRKNVSAIIHKPFF